MCARMLLKSELCIGTHRLAASLILFQKIIRLVNTSSHLMIQSEENKTREEEEDESMNYQYFVGLGGNIRDFLALILLSTGS